MDHHCPTNPEKLTSRSSVRVLLEGQESSVDCSESRSADQNGRITIAVHLIILHTRDNLI